MSLKRIYLEHKTGGHFKFYEMVENTDRTFVSKYGKIGTAGSSEVYNIDLWGKKLSEKLNKGYKIVTEEKFDKANDPNGMQNKAALLIKLRILISTIKDVLEIKDNADLAKQLLTVEKIFERIDQKDLILATDLKYCNRLFKKVVNLRNKLKK